MRRVLLTLLLGLTLVAPALGANTHGNASIPEPQFWFGEALAPFVASGCLPTVPAASLTLGAFACTGYVRGAASDLVYVSQASQAVGPLTSGNGTYWVAVHRDTSTSVPGWTRQPGTHYLWKLSSSKPAEPSAGLTVAQITVSGGAITAVTDWRLPASMVRQGVYDVQDPLYGAVDDNSTDNVAAIRLAMTAASQRGGTVYFPYKQTGTYVLTATSQATLAIPVATADYQPADQTITYHTYVQNVTGLRLIGDGITLRSTSTSGGQMMIFDGCRDLVIEGITLQSVTAFNSAGTVTTAGMNGFSFTSTAQDSERIALRNVRAAATYTLVYTYGSPASSYRVRGMTISNALAVNSYYGLAFHDNGYNVTIASARVVGGTRAYFIYGVYNHDTELVVDTGSPDVQNFAAINIKSYDVNTENISLTVRYNRVSTSSKVHFESQHNVAAQPTPGKVRNVVLNYNEEGYSGGGGVRFQYFQDAVLQATSSTLVFDNITLRGVYENDITTGTVFSGNGRGRLNLDNVVFVSGTHTILNAQGFYQYRHSTYTPTLAINGSSAGITYTTQSGSFWEIGNMVYGTAEILLSSKGAGAGGVTVTLPRTVAAFSSRTPLVQVLPISGMNGLTGHVLGYGSTNTTNVVLVQMGATGSSALTDAELTNTSRLIYTFAYSK
jgi:hypothetical protein